MTTPAEAAASAARDARVRARKAGIGSESPPDPADAPDEAHFREQYEQRVAAEAPPADDGGSRMGSDYDNLTVEQLKDILRDRDLKVGGRHDELVERLKQDDAAKLGLDKTLEQVAADQATGKPEPVYDEAGELADIEFPPEGPDTSMGRMQEAGASFTSAEELLADDGGEPEGDG